MPQLDETFSAAPMPQDRFDRKFTGPDRSLLVAVRAGKVIGSAVMHEMVEQAAEADTGYLGGFVVDAKARGSGAANTLWDGLVQWCLDRGLPGFALNTEDPRQAAIAFYRKHGAQEVAGTRGHFTVEVPEQQMTGTVPEAVTRSFFGTATTVSGPLGMGLVNRTFLAETWDTNAERFNRSVIQQIHPSFGEPLVQDNAVVARHLAAAGWEVPQTVSTVDGSLSLRDQRGGLWRQLTYIESDGAVPEVLSSEALYTIGQLVGDLHTDLAQLDYKPEFTIPHFHDVDYDSKKLEELQNFLPDAESQQLARNLLAAYASLTKLPEEPLQLVHGDPQLTNMLFQDGMPKPRAILDMDTVMIDTVWSDVGDLLRATLEDDLLSGREPDLTKLQHIVAGYRTAARPEADPAELYKIALVATQRIALDLAMRFTNDIVDNNYFSWDNKRFATRRDSHMYRAGIQWQIYEKLNDVRGL